MGPHNAQIQIQNISLETILIILHNNKEQETLLQGINKRIEIFTILAVVMENWCPLLGINRSQLMESS